MMLTNALLLYRHRHQPHSQYSDYDVPDEDAEVSSYFSEAPHNDVYDVLYTNDPYAAFDPDVSAVSEDDNHEPAESENTQPSFKKIGEQWAAMVSSHSSDHGRSRTDSQGQYSEEQTAPRNRFCRYNRHRSYGSRRRAAGTWSSPSCTPESHVQDQSVGTTPRIMPCLISEEVQTVTEDERLASQVAEDSCLTSSHYGVVAQTAADAHTVVRDVIDHEVQCSPKTAESLKKEYNRLALCIVFLLDLLGFNCYKLQYSINFDQCCYVCTERILVTRYDQIFSCSTVVGYSH